jgi:pantothenate synthetase
MAGDFVLFLATKAQKYKFFTGKTTLVNKLLFSILNPFRKVFFVRKDAKTLRLYIYKTML